MLSKELIHVFCCWAFLGKNLMLNMGGLLGENLMHNMGAFLGTNLTHNMGIFRI